MTWRADDRRHPAVSETGDTLLEVLIALVILSIASVAVILAFATSISSSAEQRNLTSIDTALRSATSEATSQMQQQSSTFFSTCPASGALPPAENAQDLSLTDLTPGYTAFVTSVQYWSSATSTYSSTCTVDAPQLITIEVEAPKGSVYSISTVVGDPLSRPLPNFGAASKLVFVTEPGSTVSGSDLSPEPRIAVEDVNGNVVTNDLSPVNVTLVGSGGTLSTTCSGSEFYGVVTFANCSITDSATGSYTLVATDVSSTDGSLTSATSSPFTVTAGS